MDIQIKDNKIFAPLKDKWLVNKPEEQVRQRYICRLIDSYGFNLDQMAQEIQVTNSQRGQGAARADIVVWRSKEDYIRQIKKYNFSKRNVQEKFKKAANSHKKICCFFCRLKSFQKPFKDYSIQ